MSDTYEPYRTGLPSPEELKNKILVKAKKIQLSTSGSIEEDDLEEEELEASVKGNVSKLSLREVFQYSMDTNELPMVPKRKESVQKIKDAKKDHEEKRMSENIEEIRKKVATESKELSDIVNYAGKKLYFK